MNPKVSCVICVYNGETYLAEAIRSIIKQTYANIELIVVDDGSSDNSGKIAKQFPEVKYVYKENKGHASALNLGLKMAQGGLVAFLDCDDLWLPEKIEKQLQEFEQNPQLQYCTTLIQEFYNPDLENYVRPALPGYVATTLMVKKSFFEDYGKFEENKKHSHVTEWFAKTKNQNVAEYTVSEVLAYRRIHKENMSWGDSSKSHDEHLEMIKKILDQRRAQEKQS